jgi:hypothetical protein
VISFLRKYGLIFQVVLTIVALAYFGIKLRGNIKPLIAFFRDHDINLFTLALSFVFLFGYYLLAVDFWRRLILLCGESINFKLALKLFSFSQFGKYLPGKIWIILGRTQMAPAHGLNPLVITVSSSIEQFFLLASGLFYIPFVLPVHYSWGLILYLAFFSILFLIFPRFRFYLDNYAKKYIKLSIVDRFSTSRIFIFLLGYILAWGIFGIGFYLFLISFLPLGWGFYPMAVGSFAVSWVLGILSIFTPGGLGVREGILIATTQRWLGPTVALGASVGSRFWLVLGEICFFLFAWGLQGSKKNKSSTPPTYHHDRGACEFSHKACDST